MSDKPKWTPGPWRVGCDYCDKPLDILGRAHLHIAKPLPIVGVGPETKHNACLIAAAPDLYAALEAAPEPPDIDGEGFDAAHAMAYVELVEKWWITIRAAALAKVKP